MDRYERQRGLVPMEKFQALTIAVVGVGAIGRQVALQLGAMGAQHLVLMDPDVVEEVNVGPQGWDPVLDVGRMKVEACAQRIEHGGYLVMQSAEAYGGRTCLAKTWGAQVVFMAVDKIAVRKLIFEQEPEQVALFDGRMNAEVVRILHAADGAGRKHYPTTLFEPHEAVQGACTARSTIYTASIAAGLMVGQFVRWLRGEDVEVEQLLNLKTMELDVVQGDPDLRRGQERVEVFG